MTSTIALTEPVAWRYEIKHGPDGEANYAWVYSGKEMVCTTKTHHAIAIVKAATELTTLLQRCEKAEAALEPFAKAGRGIGTVWADEFPVDSTRMGAVTCQLNVGHFRAARNAMGEPE